MTQSENMAEVRFRLCKSIFCTLATQGISAPADIPLLLRSAAEKYHAPVGELEVNSIAGETDHPDRVPSQSQDKKHHRRSEWQPMPVCQP